MRILFAIFILLSGCAKSQSGYLGVLSTAPPKTHAMIIMNGESNAGGRGLNSAARSYEIGERPGVKILNNNTLVFESLNIPGNNIIGHNDYNPAVSAVEHGWELGIACATDTGTLPTPTYLVKTAQGGALVAQLAAPAGRYWDSIVKRVDIARTLLMAQGDGTPPAMYMFFTLGINDIIAGTNGATWKAAVKTYFANLRSRYSSTLPIFMTLLPAGYNSYNTIITEIAAEISDCYVIQTSDAPGDGVHWSYAGQKLIAARMIATLKAHYNYY